MCLKLCKEQKCLNKPLYGLRNLKPEYCKIHKPSNNYVDIVKNKNRHCKILTCNKRATFSQKNKNPEYCLEHKLSSMYINIKCSVGNCDNSQELFNENKWYCENHKYILTLDNNVYIGSLTELPFIPFNDND